MLNYQKAENVQKLLTGAAGGNYRLLSKRGNAIADLQSNILFVNDIP